VPVSETHDEYAVHVHDEYELGQEYDECVGYEDSVHEYLVPVQLSDIICLCKSIICESTLCMREILLSSTNLCHDMCQGIRLMTIDRDNPNQMDMKSDRLILGYARSMNGMSSDSEYIPVDTYGW
jgi:hypothetical protein